jgi:hypothetical protein
MRMRIRKGYGGERGQEELVFLFTVVLACGAEGGKNRLRLDILIDNVEQT